MIEGAATTQPHIAQRLLQRVRSPEWGIAGQGLRFVIAGSLVAGVNITTTIGLHDVFSVPFQLALAIGFATGIVLHFTLQRVFVWRHYESFALRIHHQVFRYVLVGAAQYGVNALSASALPGLLGLPVELVYITTMLVIATTNFLVFRGRVFHAAPSSPEEGVLEMAPVGADASSRRHDCSNR